MLRLMLNMHSRLRVPSESWFLRPLCDRLPLEGPLSDADRQIAFEEITRENWWKDWGSSPESLRKAIFEPPASTLAELIDRVFRQTARMDGKARWGDKTPVYASYMHQIARIYPEAKFLHIIRDARDVAISFLNVNWYDSDIRRITRTWKGYVSDGLGGRAFGPDRYWEFHYEDLVKDPRGVLEKICAFIGEEFEESMLDFSQSSTHEITEGGMVFHQKTLRPPRLSDIGRWRKELTPFQVALVEAYTGETMRRAGQKPESSWPWRMAASMVKQCQLAGYQLANLGRKARNRLGLRAA